MTPDESKSLGSFYVYCGVAAVLLPLGAGFRIFFSQLHTSIARAALS